MEIIVKKWGNSLAARIPKAIADMIDLHLNQKIDIEAKNGQIIITPVGKKAYTMDELLNQCSPESVKIDDEDKAWLNDDPEGLEFQALCVSLMAASACWRQKPCGSIVLSDTGIM